MNKLAFTILIFSAFVSCNEDYQGISSLQDGDPIAFSKTRRINGLDISLGQNPGIKKWTWGGEIFSRFRSAGQVVPWNSDQPKSLNSSENGYFSYVHPKNIDIGDRCIVFGPYINIPFVADKANLQISVQGLFPWVKIADKKFHYWQGDLRLDVTTDGGTVSLAQKRIDAWDAPNAKDSELGTEFKADFNIEVAGPVSGLEVRICDVTEPTLFKLALYKIEATLID